MFSKAHGNNQISNAHVLHPKNGRACKLYPTTALEQIRVNKNHPVARLISNESLSNRVGKFSLPEPILGRGERVWVAKKNLLLQHTQNWVLKFCVRTWGQPVSHMSTFYKDIEQEKETIGSSAHCRPRHRGLGTQGGAGLQSEVLGGGARGGAAWHHEEALGGSARRLRPRSSGQQERTSLGRMTGGAVHGHDRPARMRRCCHRAWWC